MPALIEITRAAIVLTLRRHFGDVTATSAELMVGRSTLYRYIDSLEIQPAEYMKNRAMSEPAGSLILCSRCPLAPTASEPTPAAAIREARPAA